MTHSNTAGHKSWLTGLAHSMEIEHDYFPEIEGDLPSGLRGTLYRNGPGRFRLGATAKTHLLDGDGMIQAFDFVDGRVRYRNRFVRTAKYRAEQDAGHFILPTWTTRAPGGFLRNAGNRLLSQAGVTTLVKNECLYAFDEVGLPYGLHPESLETLGEKEVGPPDWNIDYKAHTKTDGRNGDWLLLGVQHGKKTWLNLVVRSAAGELLSHRSVASPRGSYIHDWFFTERYVLVLLHPVQLSLLRYLSGFSSFTDSLQWKPEMGNMLVVIDRLGAAEPVILETESSFMWHSVNAYDTADGILADFVAYDAPDHFLGERAAFRMIMDGKQGEQKHKGKVRRYVVDLKRKRVTQEILSDENHEFPIIEASVAGHRHRYGYFTTAAEATVFHNGLARMDMDNGRREVVYAGNATHLGEPIFVRDNTVDAEEGWLLTLGLDGETGRSFLGVFRANRLADGPLARIPLTHSTPLSFHGYWHDRR